MTETRSEPRGKSETRNAIIRAAERLFSEQGIEAVAMRQIAVEAGQKNNYATQYHFGSKAELVTAIYELRIGPVELRRQQILDDLNVEGRTDDLRAIVDAMLRPSAERLLTSRSESYYLRFLAAMSRTMPKEFFEAGRDLAPAYARGLERIDALLSDVPKQIRHQRMDWCLSSGIMMLGKLERDVARLTFPQRTRQVSIAIEALIDFCFGALTAPVSPESAEMLGDKV